MSFITIPELHNKGFRTLRECLFCISSTNMVEIITPSSCFSMELKNLPALFSSASEQSIRCGDHRVQHSLFTTILSQRAAERFLFISSPQHFQQMMHENESRLTTRWARGVAGGHQCSRRKIGRKGQISSKCPEMSTDSVKTSCVNFGSSSDDEALRWLVPEVAGIRNER